MSSMSKNDYQLFCTIARMSQAQLRRTMATVLQSYYDSKNIILTDDYILCEGTIPIMLVAHMDTVFPMPPDEIYYDREKNVLWSPSGLGADDRAGVFAILQILRAGYRPHVCLTTDEEVGCVGASELTIDWPTPPFNINFCIQLDRRGANDCVFYDCENDDFTKFIEKYGFETQWGTFTDISIIAPDWGCAAVNLSVGYFGEHSPTEILNAGYLYRTINRVKCILKDAITSCPAFAYIPGKWAHINSYWMNSYRKGNSINFAGGDTKKVECCKCHRYEYSDDLFYVHSKDNHKVLKPYCYECIGKSDVNWCDICGEPYECDGINYGYAICNNCLQKEILTDNDNKTADRADTESDRSHP